MKYVYIVHHSYMDCMETANHDVFVFADEQGARDCAASIIRERRDIRRFSRTNCQSPSVNGEFVDAFEDRSEYESVVMTRNKIGG